MAEDQQNYVTTVRELARDNDLVRAAFAGPSTEYKIFLEAMYDYQRSGNHVLTYTVRELASLLDLKMGSHTHDQIHTAIGNIVHRGVLLTLTHGRKTVWIQVVT